VDKFGWYYFKEQPAWDYPCQAEADGRNLYIFQRGEKALEHKKRSREKGHHGKEYIVPGIRAVRLLSFGHFGEQITTQGGFIKGPLGYEINGRQPWQNNEQQKRNAKEEVQLFQPGAVMVHEKKGRNCKAADGWKNRALDQDAGGQAKPEQHAVKPDFLLLPQINDPQRPLGQDRAEQERSIGFGKMGFSGEHNTRSQQ